MKVRKGSKEDIEGAFRLIKELALFEKAPKAVENTVEDMIRDGFGDRPVFDFFVAEVEGNIVGLALYYYCYSTWKGKYLYLEDLVVNEQYRGKGIGRQLFDAIVLKAKEERLALVGWQVLDWNESAINFYKRLGATLHPEWINCRLDRKAIEEYKG